MEPAGTHALTWWLALSMIDVLNSTPHPRPIVMGRAARNNQFPFAVAFSTRPTEQDFVLFCGGSLITQSSSSSWAISSAHCFHDLRNQTVYARLGGGDLASNDNEWRPVKSVVSARFNVYSLQNDIALVKIDAGHQQVIQVASEMPSSCAECLIYGYGSSSYYTNTITSNTVRYGRVNPISYERCEAILGRVTAPSKGSGQFCALSRNGVDACNGDSGSGLICRRGTEGRGRYELIGVTSHGMGCGGESAGVYESVIHHKHWIDSVLRQQSKEGTGRD